MENAGWNARAYRLRRFDRHSTVDGQAAREDRHRGEGRLPAHQNQNQAGLGRRGHSPGARSIPQDSFDGRRELSLHAGRRGRVQEDGQLRCDDVRTAAAP